MTKAQIQALINQIDTTGNSGTTGQELKDIFEAMNNVQTARFTIDPSTFSGPEIELLPALTNGNYRQILAISVSTYNEGGVLNPNGISTIDILNGNPIASIPITMVMFDPSLYSRQLELNFANLQNLAGSIGINSDNGFSTIGGFVNLFIEITYRECLISDF